MPVWWIWFICDIIFAISYFSGLHGWKASMYSRRIAYVEWLGKSLDNNISRGLLHAFKFPFLISLKSLRRKKNRERYRENVKYQRQSSYIKITANYQNTPLLCIQVRLKRYLEMRGADGGPWRRLCALPAFWVMGSRLSLIFHLWSSLLCFTYRRLSFFTSSEVYEQLIHSY